MQETINATKDPAKRLQLVRQLQSLRTQMQPSQGLTQQRSFEVRAQILSSIRQAAAEVARKDGYNHVIDSARPMVVYTDGSDDITAEVIKIVSIFKPISLERPSAVPLPASSPDREESQAESLTRLPRHRKNCPDNILALTMFNITILVSAGLVKLLRFMWWRINGPAEMAAQIVGLIGVSFFLASKEDRCQVAVAHWLDLTGNDGFFVTRQILLTVLTALVAFGVALTTKPEPLEHLEVFYRLVRPFGFWKPIKTNCPILQADPYGLQLTLTLCLIVLIFAAVSALLFSFLGLWGAFGLALITGGLSSLIFKHPVVKLYSA